MISGDFACVMETFMYQDKRKSSAPQYRWLRIAGVFLFVALFALSALPLNQFTDPTSSLGTTPEAAQGLPAVPAGGTPVRLGQTYYHPTGLFSVPGVETWVLPQDGAETITPRVENLLSRAGATFVNNDVGSVTHAFVENEPSRNLATPQDLNTYYTSEVLAEGWRNYDGGWTETERRVEEGRIVINFDLKHGTLTYLGRQISRMEQNWLMVLRLVAPTNNPALLDALEAAYAPGFRLWLQAKNAPMNWASLIDKAAGYIVRYPPEWRQIDGAPGRPYTISGKLGQYDWTMIAAHTPGQTVKTEDEARAWLLRTYPNAVVQTVKTETFNESVPISLSYTVPDADGNRRSQVITLLSGNNSLYTVRLQGGSGDLLTDSTLPAEFSMIRSTFFLIPFEAALPTPTPAPSPAG